jgi:hypothetical protein
MAHESRWEVRWEVAQRASREVAERLTRDDEEEVRAAARAHLAELLLDGTDEGSPE